MSIANEIQRLQSAKADIKSAIEEKGVTVGDGTIDTYAQKIGEISGGDNPLEYATASSGMYQESVFPDGYELKVHAPQLKTFAYFLWKASGVSKLVLSGNTQGNAVLFTYFARDCANLEEIDLTGFNAKLSGMNVAFQNAKKLKCIYGELDLTECTTATNAFNATDSLIYIRFKEKSIFITINFVSCQYLSDETIQSIIDGLADLTGGTAQTLTLHSTVGSKLTDEQKATITSKNWELVY